MQSGVWQLWSALPLLLILLLAGRPAAPSSVGDISILAPRFWPPFSARRAFQMCHFLLSRSTFRPVGTVSKPPPCHSTQRCPLRVLARAHRAGNRVIPIAKCVCKAGVGSCKVIFLSSSISLLLLSLSASSFPLSSYTSFFFYCFRLTLLSSFFLPFFVFFFFFC